MTLDQFLFLVAALAWPLVALISGTAFVHGCRLLVEAAESWRRTWEAQEVCRQRAAVTVAKIQQPIPPTPPLLGRGIERQTRMAERALELILGVNGGIPARQQDDATRMLVREIRKMYSELEKPTQGPAAGTGSQEQGEESVNPFGRDPYDDQEDYEGDLE